MRFRLLTTAAIAVMFALAGASSASAVTDIPATPSRNSPIVDTVGALFDSDIAELAATITDGDLNTGDRTSVLIIPTTDGEPIASYAHRVAAAWSLTSPTEKNVLIVVAMSDHTLRIDLSTALQADISDASAQAIGDDFMSPAFKDGDIYGGLDFGISALQAAGTGQSFDPDLTDGQIPDIYTANGEVVTGDGGPFFPDATLSQSPDMVGLTGLVGGFFVLVIIAIVVIVIIRLAGGNAGGSSQRYQRRYFRQNGSMAGYVGPMALGSHLGPHHNRGERDPFDNDPNAGGFGAGTGASAGGDIGMSGGMSGGAGGMSGGSDGGSSGGSSDSGSSGGSTSSW